VVPEFGAFASDLTTYPASAVGIPPAAAAAVRSLNHSPPEKKLGDIMSQIRRVV